MSDQWPINRQQFPYAPPDHEVSDLWRYLASIAGNSGTWYAPINGEMVNTRTGEIVPVQDNPNYGDD